MRSVLLLLLALGVAERASALTPAESFYLDQIKPVLAARCFACHGVLKQESGLRLDSIATIQKGGDNGPIVIANQADQSPLVARITAGEEERMPPEGEPLKPAEIDAIKTWIAQGVQAPADDRPEPDPREHWAFRTPQRPVVPAVANAAWAQNPIDAFIAAEHERQRLVPQPLADKRLWLRRATLDLIGLPPTSAELAAFLSDDSADAYDKVAARLLDSPQYGERWGRHWMDVWRYSDWWGLGDELRNSQRHIWHWRDWIVESLNADKGYDQMLREMLAADELYPNDLDRLRATGFLARQYFKFNRTSWLDETIEHTSKAMLGLTFNCAKCHDHKYDPIAQLDYYRLRAIFEPYQLRTDMIPGETNLERDGIPRPFDCALAAETFVHIRGNESNPDRSRVVTPGMPGFLPPGELKIAPVELPVDAYQPGLRPFVLQAYQQAAERRVVDARAALETARSKLAESSLSAEGSLPVDQAALAVVVAERALAAAEAHAAAVLARATADRLRSVVRLGAADPNAQATEESVRAAARAERASAGVAADETAARAQLAVLQAAPEKRAEAEKKLTEAQAAALAAQQALLAPGDSYAPLVGAIKTLESNLETEESRRKPFPQTSTGRRAALAQWITDRQNPLTARVAVNQIWSRHFGVGLVPTVFDFGRKGLPPSHPELLDWLAVELMEHDWSMKHVHRLIVTSSTYRMSSSSAGASAETLAADPDNRFHWRANPLHMEAQVVRDSLLYLAGELDLTRGGPSIAVTDEASRRRSLYFVHSQNDHQKFLAMFDDAPVQECYRRAESIVPQQALALENSPLATSMSEKITRMILAADPQASPRDFIRAAFRTVLLVEPSEAEQAAAEGALARLVELARNENRPDPTARAQTNLIQALLNHNDFVTIR